MYSNSNSVYVSIENCTNMGTVNGSGNRKYGYTYDGNIEKIFDVIRTGGIVGYAVKVKVNQVKNTGTIECLSSVDSPIVLGGTVGELRNGDITNSYNNGEVKGNKVLGIGGILGSGIYNININNCYNTKPITGGKNVGGIAGAATQANIRYCYNTQKITANAERGGGIVGLQCSFNDADYTNNAIWYCYNVGNVTGNITGTMAGQIKYFSADYVYGVNGTSSDLLGAYSNYKKDGTHYGLLDKGELISIILSNYGSNFKEDTSNINNGYPILSWQSLEQWINELSKAGEYPANIYEYNIIISSS